MSATDLRCFPGKNLVDQLLALARDPGDLEAADFDQLLGDFDFLRRQRNDGFGVRIGVLVFGPRLHGRSPPDARIAKQTPVLARRVDSSP